MRVYQVRDPLRLGNESLTMLFYIYSIAVGVCAVLGLAAIRGLRHEQQARRDKAKLIKALQNAGMIKRVRE